MSEDTASRVHLSPADIRTLHELLVETSAATSAGVVSPGDIDYAVDQVRAGPFGRTPDSRHDAAAELIRLIAANHPFVDGNKRTALMSARCFYALNGTRFDYDRDIKTILKAYATDAPAVDAQEVVEYLRTHTEPLPRAYEATVELWLRYLEDPNEREASRVTLLRFLGRQDLDEHAAIYEELATE
ncbi:MAG: type II toxin-antitoxin system death-on-curing family toxin [Halobacteriaceae archaeon]